MGIMRAAIDCDRPIPIKGALAKGTVACDESKQLYFGKALLDAYLLEENVQYYEIVVHHSAEEQVKTNQLGMFIDIDSLVSRSPIEKQNFDRPFKSFSNNFS